MWRSVDVMMRLLWVRRCECAQDGGEGVVRGDECGPCLDKVLKGGLMVWGGGGCGGAWLGDGD